MSPYIPIIITIGVAILLAIILIFSGAREAVVSTDTTRQRLEEYVFIPEIQQQSEGIRRRTRFSRFRYRINLMLNVLGSESLNLQLISANWPITETEYLLIRYGGALLCFIAGWLLFRSIFPGIGIGIIAYLIPGLILMRSIQQRQTKFQRQLVDVLVLLSGAVRAGYGVQQALDIVVREMKAPASDEFKRVRHEIGLGLSLGQALNNLHARMQNDDLYIVITAININQQVGGNLVTMLDAVMKTVRDRVRLFNEVRVLTIQQKFNSYVLTLLPVLAGAGMFILNPSYVSKMLEPGIFLCFPIGAVLGIIIGNIVILRMSKIEV